MSTPSTPPPPAIPFHVNINNTFGAVYIGLIFGAVFYGITALQTIFYYNTYPKDRPAIKALVGVIWVLDTLSLAMISHGVYTYLVTDFANPLAALGFVWSISSEPIVSAVVSLLVHQFLVYRIYALNRDWMLWAIFLGLFSLFPFAMGIVAVWRTDTGSQLQATVRNELHWIAIVSCVTTSWLDLTIAGTICLQLFRGRTGFSSTQKIINLLTLYVVTSGLITTSLNMAVMISFLASPNTLLFQLFGISCSKAYANTLLATLNSRQSIRGRATETIAGTSTTNVSAFRAGTGSGGAKPFNNNNANGSKYDIPLPPLHPLSSEKTVVEIHKNTHVDV